MKIAAITPSYFQSESPAFNPIMRLVERVSLSQSLSRNEGRIERRSENQDC
jgi:hypothetical protein